MEKPSAMHREETFSELADWAFADSSEGSDKRSSSFSRLDDMLPDELPQQFDSPTSPRTDVCKLAGLTPEEEQELCAKLKVDAPPQAPAPSCSRKRSRDAAESSAAADNGGLTLGDAAEEGMGRREMMAMAIGGRLTQSGVTEDAVGRREVMAMNIVMQMELTARVYQLLLAQRNELLQRQEPAVDSSASERRQQLLKVETLKGLVLQQRMVQNQAVLVCMEEQRIRASDAS